MPGVYGSGYHGSGTEGISSESVEVQADSSSTVRLVRGPLGYASELSLNACKQSQKHQEGSEDLPQEEGDIQKATGANNGSVAVCSSGRPCGESSFKVNELAFPLLSETGQKGQAASFSELSSSSVEEMAQAEGPDVVSPLQASAFSVGHLHRCLSPGLGVRTSSGMSLSGVWSRAFQGLHLNVLELVAIYIGLKRLPI